MRRSQLLFVKMFTLRQLLLPVALLSSSVFGVPLSENGNFEDSYNDRIWGGQGATAGQFPYQIALLFNGMDSAFKHSCGGSILTGRFIVTAGHCRDETYPGPENYRIVVGAHRRHGEDGTVHNIKRWIVHEDFFMNYTGAMRNDIALIETASAIQFTKLVAPIALNPKFIKDGHQAMASGWGGTNVSLTATRREKFLIENNIFVCIRQDNIETLKFIKMTTLTNVDCINRFAKFNKRPVPVRDETLCVYSGQKRHGICTGDSGGPLASEHKLIGISSWSLQGWNDCALGFPDAFTRISSYVDWINQKMHASLCNNSNTFG